MTFGVDSKLSKDDRKGTQRIRRIASQVMFLLEINFSFDSFLF